MYCTFGIPQANQEPVQFLHYETGQYYKRHMDQTRPDFRPCGPRLLTLFIYLNAVEEGGGGETVFPDLDPPLRVAPRKAGMALLWPSVLGRDLATPDLRTAHEAAPVLRGEKFALNLWVHQHNYVVPTAWACTGGAF